MAKERKAVYNPEADRRWNEKNRERRNYISARGASRSFLRKHATLEDLDEMEHIIALRRACYPLQLDAKNQPCEQ